jgi:hypothetical protein
MMTFGQYEIDITTKTHVYMLRQYLRFLIYFSMWLRDWEQLKQFFDLISLGALNRFTELWPGLLNDIKIVFLPILGLYASLL